MNNLRLLTQSDVNNLVNKRAGESKFGAQIQLISNFNSIYDELLNLDVDYVVFGICEDVGVFAKSGNRGAYSTWHSTLKVLLNIESNDFINAKRIAILGHLDYSQILSELKTLNPNRKKDLNYARSVVELIDKEVSDITYKIIKSGKKPIAIGGGQNNAYGLIKGSALAVNQPVNVANLDWKADFGKEEGRHHENAFSYAYAEGFLKNYFAFGLHESQLPQSLSNKMNKLKTIRYNTFEQIEIRKDLKFNTEVNAVLEHVSSAQFGMEIDCNAVSEIPSLNNSNIGFSINKARRWVDQLSKHKNVQYLHLSEASPKNKQQHKIGLLLTYLITDFIKSS